jgi:putative acetyltransferase
MAIPHPTVREEENGDLDAIARVHQAAFERSAEAQLVLELRAEGLALASHVALEGDRLVAHALYSRMHVDTPGGPVAAVALGPIAVIPERQGKGLGGAVIRAGLAAIRARGERLILVLGHPAYYPRFGFDPAVGARISAPWSGSAWMGMDLRGEPVTGSARYPEPWSKVD